MGGKIIATVPKGGEHLHVFVDADSTRAAAAENPEGFEERWCGKRHVRVRIFPPAAGSILVLELVEEAWGLKASKELVQLLDG